MAFRVATLNFAGLLVVSGLMLFLYAASGGHPWEPTTLSIYSGMLLYCAISFVSVMPFVRASTMPAFGIAANLMLLPVLLISAEAPTALLLLTPFLVLTSLWYAAFRARQRKDAQPRAATDGPEKTGPAAEL